MAVTDPGPCLYAELGTCDGPVALYASGRKCRRHGPPPQPKGDPLWVPYGATPAPARELHPPHPSAVVQLERQEVKRDAALDAVAANTDDEWRELARRAVWACATSRESFTVDNVWEELERQGVPAPAEPRALGPILMRAIRAGAIRDTGRMDRSHRRHATKVTVYERARP